MSQELRKKNSEKSKVVIKDCGSYELEELTGAISAGVEHLGGWDKFVHPGSTVLLKPNLIGPKTPESGAVTHKEFVRALVRLLRGRGCTVWIGDSAGGAIAGISPTARGMASAGYEQLAAEEGAVIKNFDREGVKEIRTGREENPVMYLAKPLFDADLVINLPKLKTHVAATYTGAVKNLFGCIPGLKKAEYHKMYPDTASFGKVLADINKALPVRLHIMDGVVAMQGRGPTAGTLYAAGKILLSEDPLALDAAGTGMLGLVLKDLPIFNAARETGIWNWEPGTFDVLGDYGSLPLLAGFEIPRPYSVKPGGAKIFGWVIDFLKTRPKIDLKKCVHCGTCTESCPKKVIDGDTMEIDYTGCIECMCCHELCMYGAVELRNVKPLAGLLMRFSGRA